MTEMSTSEVLNKAADLIEERGWTKGNTGWSGEAGGLCLEGGILAAAGFGTEDYADREFVTCPAYRAVKSYLGLEADEALYEWNDGIFSFSDETRTAEDVIGVLRATALIEGERESVEV